MSFREHRRQAVWENFILAPIQSVPVDLRQKHSIKYRVVRKILFVLVCRIRMTEPDSTVETDSTLLDTTTLSQLQTKR